MSLIQGGMNEWTVSISLGGLEEYTSATLYGLGHPRLGMAQSVSVVWALPSWSSGILAPGQGLAPGYEEQPPPLLTSCVSAREDWA